MKIEVEFVSPLTDKQHRRYTMYLSGMTLDEIAKKECSGLTSVWQSVNQAKKKLKKFSKHTKNIRKYQD